MEAVLRRLSISRSIRRNEGWTEKEREDRSETGIDVEIGLHYS